MTSVTVGALPSHPESPSTVGRRWRTGAVLLLLADASFVASLVFSYFYLRGLNTDKAWLAPHGKIAAIWVGWALAGGLALSAIAYRRGQQAISADNERSLVSWTGVAVLLVVVVIVGQVVQLASFPFGVNDSSYTSSVYVLAGANLFHLLLTLFIGVGLWNRARLHLYSASTDWQVRIVGIWWAWVAVAAVLSAATTSFVASPNIG